MSADILKPRYLSKSRFKEALDCMTKLYYTGKKDEYANQSLDDPFLKALAEGGFQVGELAKFMFCEDPVAEDITVDTLDYNESLRITAQKWSMPGKVVIAEAAFFFEDLFVRADIVVKEGKKIKLYEVKAKSLDGEEVDEEGDENNFLSFAGKKNECVKKNWRSYLYDLAFQKYVISKCFPDHEVHAHLLLVDKSKKAGIEGMNQLFQIERNGDKTKVRIREGLKRADLGTQIMKAVSMDMIIDKIWNVYKVPASISQTLTFEEFVHLCRDAYRKDQRIWAAVKTDCKKCSYFSIPGKDDGKKDGRMECWKNASRLSEQLLRQPLTYELWNGRVDKLIEGGTYLLSNIKEEDIMPSGSDVGEFNKDGLTQYGRRIMQVRKVRQNDNSYYFDREGFLETAENWKWPYHMIDFETSMVALPFHKDTAPYQGIAFQFSHHVLHEDGRVEHVDQFLDFTKGEYPNALFAKRLMESLSGDNGTIFRYHNHENTYLRMIRGQLAQGMGNLSAAERENVIAFIDSITKYKLDGNKKNEVAGPRNMVDLYDIVKRYYYPPSSGGKIGLKFILPAIIRDCPGLVQKYGRKGVYGKSLAMKSLNFEDHRWIDPEFKNDPYKTLPKVFDNIDRETLDNLVGGFDELRDGGAALTAYSYLQYSHLDENTRKNIAEALLRYCELDTLAMVMVMQGLRELCG
ncbi:MAG: hypothetical protein Fur0041_14010 [Bacteroidia bacterium]